MCQSASHGCVVLWGWQIRVPNVSAFSMTTDVVRLSATQYSDSSAEQENNNKKHSLVSIKSTTKQQQQQLG